MSEIKKQILLITRSIEGELADNGVVFLRDIITNVEWAKSVDFFNNTDSPVRIVLMSEDELGNGSGALLPPGQNFTIEGDTEIGIYLPNLVVICEEDLTDGEFNIVIEAHEVISGNVLFEEPEPEPEP